MSDDELFRQAMRDVQAISDNKNIVRRKAPPRVAIRQREHGVYECTDHAIPRLNTGDSVWSLHADGVSATVLRRLATGQPAIDATLDLHGYTQQQAHDALDREISRLRNQGGRVLRIIHGRGLHSGGKPVLKHAVYHILQHSALAVRVLAVVPEPGSAGGAALVLLRRER